jgi:hypothetical protein
MANFVFRDDPIRTELELGVDAQTAGEELDRIRQEHGTLEPGTVVDESRPEEAPLHPALSGATRRLPSFTGSTRHPTSSNRSGLWFSRVILSLWSGPVLTFPKVNTTRSPWRTTTRCGSS